MDGDSVATRLTRCGTAGCRPQGLWCEVSERPWRAGVAIFGRPVGIPSPRTGALEWPALVLESSTLA